MLTLLLIVLTTTACDAGTNAGQSIPTIPPSKQGVTFETLANTSPKNIDFGLTISISEPVAPDQPQYSLSPVFFVANTPVQYSKAIDFKQGEKLVCNGISLPTNSESAYISNTIPAPGTVFNCTYTSPQGQASFSVTTPEATQLVTPKPNATVTRSKQTPIVIAPTSACQSMGILVGSKNAFGGYSGGIGPAPSGCATHQQVDTTSASVGPGELGLEEVDNTTPITNNAGFHSLLLSVMTYKNIPVIWK